MKTLSSRRLGFTLVELMVTLAIISMMMGLVAISFPRYNEHEELTRAVDKLRMGILTARLWAKRDQVVSGIKWLDADTTLPNDRPNTTPAVSSPTHKYVRGFVYVQQPLEIVKGTLASFNPSTPNSVTVDLAFDKPPPAAVSPYSRLKFSSNPYGSDYIRFESDDPHRIINRSPGANPNQAILTLASPITIGLLDKHILNIIRAPEEIPFEEEVTFGDRIELELLLNLGTMQNILLFSPNGQIYNPSKTYLDLTLRQTLADGVETDVVRLDTSTGSSRYVSR